MKNIFRQWIGYALRGRNDFGRKEAALGQPLEICTGTVWPSYSMVSSLRTSARLIFRMLRQARE